MKLRLTILSVIAASFVWAQTPATANAFPTYVLAGASFNQIGTPPVNLIAGAIYPTGNSVLEYTSTIINIVPKTAIVAGTGKNFYTFSTSAQQSVHKVIYQGPKFVLLVGGGAGAVFSQASPSGANVNFAASVTATMAYQLSAKWGIAVPVQGIYTPQGWDLVPAIAVVFKP